MNVDSMLYEMLGRVYQNNTFDFWFAVLLFMYVGGIYGIGIYIGFCFGDDRTRLALCIVPMFFAWLVCGGIIINDSYEHERHLKTEIMLHDEEMLPLFKKYKDVLVGIKELKDKREEEKKKNESEGN